MEKNSYKKLAERLDALPNGFPPTDDGAELRLLARLFTPEEADLASQLRLTWEVPEQVARRLGRDTAKVRALLKGMAAALLYFLKGACIQVSYAPVKYIFTCFKEILFAVFMTHS